ncbi:MAG: glutamate--tRNA ligase, partial [Bacilli bacterium]|nr:glutamate--tRNA ligase [Bacilli bacterium]
DILPLIKFFYQYYYEEMKKDIVWPENYKLEDIKQVLTEYAKVFNLEATEEEWFEQMKEVAILCGYATNRKEYKANPEAFKGQVSDVAAILRLAITLRLQSPNLYYVMKILGREEVLRRLNAFC